MENQKSKDQNKSLYITVIVILVALAVVVGVTSAVGKKSGYSSDPDALATDEFLLNEERNPSDSKAEDEGGKGGNADTEDTEKNNENAVNTDDAVDANAGVSDSDKESEETEDPASVLPEFSSPVAGEVLNPHSDTVPVFSITMNDYRTHTGVDILASPGEAVMAAADGVIGAIYEDPMMGTCMTVVHSGGAVSTYKGLYSTLPDGIVQGAAVTKGQVIAAVGDTALAEIAEEPHVHYELSIDGVAVDPCLYITFDAVSYEG